MVRTSGATPYHAEKLTGLACNNPAQLTVNPIDRMMPRIWKPVCLLLVLILLEVARVYFIMPFPGSQLDDTANLSRVQLAYWLHQYAPWVRLAGILALIVIVAQVLSSPALRWHRWFVLAGVTLYGVVLYMVNEQMMADRMFEQPKTKRLVSLSQNRIPMNKLVLGLIENGDARAYPLQLIGYHHQVRDTIGGKPVMITYCTVCRTGRVFDPVVAGKPETFRLVGMDHFNAMFEDKRTGSWWRQATGEAILGPRKGHVLAELPARQMTLAAWSDEHPATLVMQPDPAFTEETDSLDTYDLGLKRGKLTGRDVASWRNKSWVVGVLARGDASAFDWNALVQKRLIQGTVGGLPVVLMMAPDSLSFGAFSREVGGQTLTFSQGSGGRISDTGTGSVWNTQGRAIAGPLAGQHLSPVRAYQEFWHSWRSFHPATTQVR